MPAADAGELYDRALTWIADKRSVDGSTTFHDRDLKRINGLAALSIPRGKSFLSSEDKYRVDYSIEVKDGRYRFKIREIYFVYADRPNILVLTGNSKKVLNRVSEHMEEHLRSSLLLAMSKRTDDW